MDKKKTDNTAFEGLACYRLGLRADGGPFSDLGCCPSYGSSDCPITMGIVADGCRCTGDEMYEWLDGSLYAITQS